MTSLPVIQGILTDIGRTQRRITPAVQQGVTALTALTGVCQIADKGLNESVARTVHAMGGPAQCQKVIGAWGQAQEKYAEAMQVAEHLKRLLADGATYTSLGIAELEKIQRQLGGVGR